MKWQEALLSDSFVDIADLAPTPIGVVVQRDVFNNVDRCVAMLPAAQARCLRPRFFVGLSVAQTARALHREEGATRPLQCRAIAKAPPDPHRVGGRVSLQISDDPRPRVGVLRGPVCVEGFGASHSGQYRDLVEDGSYELFPSGRDQKC